MEQHLAMNELISAALRVTRLMETDKQVAQLRDELEKAKAELDNVKEDTADLIIERDELKQRAERAESESDTRRRLLVAANELTAMLTNERDEALAKLERTDYHAATESMKDIADALGYGNMYAFRDVASDAIACIKEWHKRVREAQQPQGEVLFEGVRSIDQGELGCLIRGEWAVIKNKVNQDNVHVTVRKAGE